MIIIIVIIKRRRPVTAAQMAISDNDAAPQVTSDYDGGETWQ